MVCRTPGSHNPRRSEATTQDASTKHGRTNPRRYDRAVQTGEEEQFVKDGICVDPPLCSGRSQGKYGSRIIGLVCAGETVEKIGEVDEMGERELVLVVSVRCCREGDMTRG